MKVYVNNFKSILQDKDSKAIFIFGEDQGKRSYILKLISSILEDKTKESLETIKYQSSDLSKKMRILRQNLTSPSFLGQRYLVIVEGQTEGLIDFLQSLGDQFIHYLVVISDSAPTNSKLRSFFENHSTFLALPCYEDTKEEIENFAKSLLKRYQIQIKPEWLSYLMASLNSHYEITRQELDLFLSSFPPGHKLQEEDFKRLPALQKNNKFDQLYYTFHKPDSGFFIYFKEFLEQEPNSLLRGFQKHIERLIKGSLLLKEGLGIDKIIKTLHPPVFYMFHKLFEEQVKCFSFDELELMLISLQAYEKESRSTRVDSKIFIGQNLILFFKKFNKN